MLKQLRYFFESQGGLLVLIFAAFLVAVAFACVVILWAPQNDKAFMLVSVLASGFAGSLTTAAQVRSGRKSLPNDKRPDA
jgi:fluoride ion exporter CrcB/FEX